MKKLLAFLGLAMCAFTATASPIDSVVVFGDSLSDNGNLYYYTKHQIPASPPYFQGRFSNGKIWIETLVESLYSSDAHPYEHLLDYAFGGAGVLKNANGTNFSLDDEIDTYLTTTANNMAQSNGLYVVWIGANDYFSIASEDQNVVLTAVNDGIKSNIMKLAERGAKHIMVMGLPNLGLTPLARSLGKKAFFTSLSERHNQILETNLSILKSSYSDVEWLFFNTNELFNKVKTNPEIYGLTNITDSCNAYQGPAPKSLILMASSGHLQHKTDDCSEFLFYDLMHPTEAGHNLISRELMSTLAETDMEFG